MYTGCEVWGGCENKPARQVTYIINQNSSGKTVAQRYTIVLYRSIDKEAINHRHASTRAFMTYNGTQNLHTSQCRTPLLGLQSSAATLHNTLATSCPTRQTQALLRLLAMVRHGAEEERSEGSTSAGEGGLGEGGWGQGTSSAWAGARGRRPGRRAGR